MGSTLIAAWVAHVTFWVLIAWGWVTSELGVISRVVFLALWCAGFFGLPYVPNGEWFFLSYVAILDIALVFVLFKGDLRIT